MWLSLVFSIRNPNFLISVVVLISLYFNKILLKNTRIKSFSPKRCKPPYWFDDDKLLARQTVRIDVFGVTEKLVK